jgi:hypothetical protein
MLSSLKRCPLVGELLLNTIVKNINLTIWEKIKNSLEHCLECLDKFINYLKNNISKIVVVNKAVCKEYKYYPL